MFYQNKVLIRFFFFFPSLSSELVHSNLLPLFDFRLLGSQSSFRNPFDFDRRLVRAAGIDCEVLRVAPTKDVARAPQCAPLIMRHYFYASDVCAR